MLPLKVICLYDLTNFFYTTFIFIAVFPREDLTFRLFILSMGVFFAVAANILLHYITLLTFQN